MVKQWFYILGLTIVLGSTFFLACSPTHASAAIPAYALEGPIWANQPSPGHCCASLGAQYVSMSSKDKYGYDAARASWNVSPAYIEFNQVSSSSIQFTEVNIANSGWDAQTQLSWIGLFGEHFTAATVQANYYYLQGYQDSDVKLVLAHELGHVTGLAHVNGCVLMDTDIVDLNHEGLCRVTGPVQDDINGINAMY